MEGGDGGAGKVTFSEHRFRVSVTEVYPPTHTHTRAIVMIMIP